MSYSTLDKHTRQKLSEDFNKIMGERDILKIINLYNKSLHNINFAGPFVCFAGPRLPINSKGLVAFLKTMLTTLAKAEPPVPLD